MRTSFAIVRGTAPRMSRRAIGSGPEDGSSIRPYASTTTSPARAFYPVESVLILAAGSSANIVQLARVRVVPVGMKARE